MFLFVLYGDYSNRSISRGTSRPQVLAYYGTTNAAMQMSLFGRATLDDTLYSRADSLIE
jgi:hypothetical protein